MKKRDSTWVGMLAALGVGLAASSTAADSISLAGKWRFALDRADKGIKEGWCQRTLPDQINLPGALQNQGFGDDVSTNTVWTGGSAIEQWYKLPRYEKYRQPGNIKLPFFLQPEKHYVGVAWYERDIELPSSWRGRRVVLTLERTHWETRVWVDGKPFGTNDSLCTSHVYDLGTGLAPGRHRLSIRVDNRMLVNVGDRAHSVSDETQGNWNGIVGDISLHATPLVWIDDLQIFPRLKTKSVMVRGRLGNATGRTVTNSVGFCLLDHFDARPRLPTTNISLVCGSEGGAFEVEVKCANKVVAWDEFNPRQFELTVQTGDFPHADRRTVRFGFREIATRDRQFVLNGRPTFFRGTLECCIFPLTGYPPTDVDSWKRIIGTCKAHGLNHIRFHSWCPPEAAFVAADELGFYYQIECAVWSHPGCGLPINNWLYRESERIVRAYGNHPSFLLLTHGNEPHWPEHKEYLAAWVNYWKARDPRRLYTSGSAYPQLPENQYHVYHRSRGPSGWLGRDYRKTIEPFDVPIIVHEMGQWCVYPNFDEMAKYTGPLKPKNFEIFRDSLAEHGMLHQGKNFLMASGKLQALCYKEEIEAALRTPGIGGFQLLDLHDFPGQGTALVGVLDPFWDSKPYITPAEFRRFCNTTVPLARLLRRTWTTAETLTADVEIAHFGATPLENARPYWKVLTADGRVVARGEFPVQTVPIGQGTKLGQISLALGEFPAPSQYKLVVGLKGTGFENDWNFWVYPTESPAPPDDVLVASSFDEAVGKRLAGGGKVLLAAEELGTGNPPLGFEPIFWNRFMFHAQNRQTLGLLCNPKHPALAQFPTEYFQEFQWRDIVTMARGVPLDGLPKELQPIVQPIDDWNTNRKLGLVFECRVGRGKLLVCGADLSKDLEHRPAARQLRTSLLAYAASEAFNPEVEVAERSLAEVLKLGGP